MLLSTKYITNGIEDLTYHARNEKGELCPNVEMRINIQEFSFDGGVTFEQFVESVNSKRKTLSEVAEMVDSKDTQGND